MLLHSYTSTQYPIYIYSPFFLPSLCYPFIIFSFLYTLLFPFTLPSFLLFLYFFLLHLSLYPSLLSFHLSLIPVFPVPHSLSPLSLSLSTFPLLPLPPSPPFLFLFPSTRMLYLLVSSTSSFRFHLLLFLFLNPLPVLLSTLFHFFIFLFPCTHIYSLSRSGFFSLSFFSFSPLSIFLSMLSSPFPSKQLYLRFLYFPFPPFLRVCPRRPSSPFIFSPILSPPVL